MNMTLDERGGKGDREDLHIEKYVWKKETFILVALSALNRDY